MTRPEAIEKVRKLLKRNGRTDAEADTAQILAAAIAEKHGIDIAALETDEQNPESVITHKVVGKWATVPDEAVYASLVCAEFFEVESFRLRGFLDQELVFVGLDHHIQVAEYVFGFLKGEFSRQWNWNRGRMKKRKQFIWGCYMGLMGKLRERFAAPPSNGLVVAWKAKREKYIAETWGEMTSSSAAPKERRCRAMVAGYMAGQDIEIRPGVNGGNGKAAPALASGAVKGLLA